MTEDGHSTEECGSEELKPGTASSSKKSTSIRRLVLLTMVAYLMCVTVIGYFQRSLIYQPTPCERLLASQARLPRTTVDVMVKSFDGVELHGWLVLSGTSANADSVDVKQALSNDRPVVVYFPGNAGNRWMRYVQLSTLASLNADVLIVDYRGYADNRGKPTEENFARDARSIWNYLTVDLAVPSHRVVIYGESLGGGVAIRLASDLCQEGIEPGGLIAQSTFNSLVSVAQAHFPFLPVSWLLIDRYPSAKRIAKVTCPILQIHGRRDSVVPFQFGQKLFDAAPATSMTGIAKRQFVMPERDHNDIYSEAPDRNLTLIDELRRFLDQVADAAKP